jgi:hypothetical protein
MDEATGFSILCSIMSSIATLFILLIDTGKKGRSGPDWIWKITSKWHVRRILYTDDGRFRKSVKISALLCILFFNIAIWTAWLFGVLD